MSAYVPPHLRRRIVAASAAAPNNTKKVKFIGNRTGNTNELPNTGVRYSPKSPSAAPAKKTLKNKPRVGPSPSNKPPAAPTRNIRKLPPKFRNMVLEHYGLTLKKKKQKKQKRRQTHRHHKKHHKR